MPPVASNKSSRDKVRAHRERLRARGLRPIQIWVPDVRSTTFRSAAHQQSLAVANSLQQRLTFVGAAMGRMLADDNFINLLRAEGLETLPRPLEEKIRESG
ncbi:MAG: antitoxin MazE family protein, partial [Methylocystis sp.]